MMTFLVTGTATRPCPPSAPVGLHFIKAGALRSRLLLMSLVLLTLGLLCARPAQAQQDPGHYWKITYSQTGTTSYAVPDQPVPGQSTGLHP